MREDVSIFEGNFLQVIFILLLSLDGYINSVMFVCMLFLCKFHFFFSSFSIIWFAGCLCTFAAAMLRLEWKMGQQQRNNGLLIFLGVLILCSMAAGQR